MKDYHTSAMAVFSRLVRENMHGPPPTARPGMSCGEALRIMREFPSSCIVIAAPGGRPIGILTEQDVVRRIAFINPSSTPVTEVMTSPLKIIHDSDYLFKGIAIMHSFGLRHLPVVDCSGHLTGILDLPDALAGAGMPAVDLMELLMHDETLEGLTRIKEAEVGAAQALLKDGVPATEIQTLLTQINNDMYRAVRDIIIRELVEEGWGGPPVEFDIIVMGSGGRGESFLFPDQDNGFILSDYPERQHSAVDSYFMEVADRMSTMLDTAGVPRCRGYVMAINPTWRKSLSQWYMQINSWLERPDHINLRYVDIFFDFRHISGREDLASHLRAHVTGMIRNNHVFLREMQLAQDDHGVALNKFGKLVPEKAPPHKGKINLKYRGLLPLVESVRLLALREGVNKTSTFGRIEALHSSGILSQDERDSLSRAFHKLTFFILRQQIRDFRNKSEVSPYVSPDTFSGSEKNALTDSLRAVHAFRSRVHCEFTGDVF